MNRRKFINQSAWSAASMLLFPMWYQSCKKAGLFEESTFKGKVIIIGAGVTGLYAANLLHQQGIDVIILEASADHGGRIRSLRDFADFDIELGAEEIHGEKSIFYDLVRDSGASFIDPPLNDYYYFNGNLKSQSEAEQNTFYNVMMQHADSFATYTGADTDAMTYAQLAGISSNVEHLWNGIVANERGTSADKLGMHGLREEWQSWSAGKADLMIRNKSLYDIITSAFQPIINRISYNTPVQSIDHQTSNVIITDILGNEHTADKVIVTVPLPILQQGIINFVPALAQDKIIAMGKIGMDRGIKVIIRFSQRIWTEGTGSIFGPGLVPEYWASSEGGRSSQYYVLTAFVTGPAADELAALGTNMIDELLADLNNILGSASDYYIDHVIQDWGAEAYIGGAYSYTAPGTGTARDIIASPIGNKLFFAGEATHTGTHHGTVHGAMETGLRAVTEILQAR